jgi:hypothetical protein
VLGRIGGGDTTAVTSVGTWIDLPIFNRDQGNIAIEHAMRSKLDDEYTAPLVALVSEVRVLLAAQSPLERQLPEAKVAAEFARILMLIARLRALPTPA